MSSRTSAGGPGQVRSPYNDGPPSAGMKGTPMAKKKGRSKERPAPKPKSLHKQLRKAKTALEKAAAKRDRAQARVDALSIIADEIRAQLAAVEKVEAGKDVTPEPRTVAAKRSAAKRSAAKGSAAKVVASAAKPAARKPASAKKPAAAKEPAAAKTATQEASATPRPSATRTPTTKRSSRKPAPAKSAE